MTEQAKVQPRQVQAYQSLRAVTVDTAATCGAQLGINLLLEDGTLATTSKLAALFGGGTAGSAIVSTDDVAEGQFNLWFTDRRAQDAAGSILANSTNVTLTYSGGTSITADLTNVTVTVGGTLKKRAFDVKGRLAQEAAATTDDLTEGATNLWFTASRVLAAALSGLSTATNAAIAVTDTILQAFGKLQAQITANLVPKGYIDGLQMKWVSGTALTLGSGSCYIEGTNTVLRVTADIAKAGLSLTANTWYHVYPYDNAGTPDFILSTTAPSAPYNGTARSLAGNTAKRYRGSVLTDSTGNIKKFYHHQRINFVQYLTDVIPQLILNGGTATTSTSVSASPYVPVTARIAKLLGFNNSTASFMFISNSDGPAVPSGYLAACAPQAYLAFDCLLDSSQALVYAFNSTPSAGGFLRVMGYQFEC